METKENKGYVLAASGAAILLAALASAFVSRAVVNLVSTSPPSAMQQSEEVAALQTHVLPVVKDLRATWYLNQGSRSGSIHWKRGHFAMDASSAGQVGDASFDDETSASYEQFAAAIRASGVPTNRLSDAKFAADGSLRFASFHRRGGGISYVFTYIYSPGERPPAWSSNIGPVVLTRIADSDWWFEQSPND